MLSKTFPEAHRHLKRVWTSEPQVAAWLQIGSPRLFIRHSGTLGYSGQLRHTAGMRRQIPLERFLASLWTRHIRPGMMKFELRMRLLWVQTHAHSNAVPRPHYGHKTRTPDACSPLGFLY